MAEDQTSEETLEKEETSTETAEQGEAQQTQEPEVDYKAKFIESQREAIRLAKELKEIKTEKAVIEEAEEDTGEGETLEEIVDKKVQEKVAPMVKKDESERVDKWFNSHPDSADYLKKIEETYLDSPGKTVEEKLENSFLIAKKDAMRNAGKTEMAFSLYQREHSIAGGGGVSTYSEESPSLTPEEEMVATKLGIKPADYAKRKKESNK